MTLISSLNADRSTHNDYGGTVGITATRAICLALWPFRTTLFCVRLELRPKVEVVLVAGRHGAPAKHNQVESYIAYHPTASIHNIFLTPIRTRRQKVIFPDGVGSRIGKGNPDKTKLLNLEQWRSLQPYPRFESRHG